MLSTTMREASRGTMTASTFSTAEPNGNNNHSLYCTDVPESAGGLAFAMLESGHL